jgi:hypothetical protein
LTTILRRLALAGLILGPLLLVAAMAYIAMLSVHPARPTVATVTNIADQTSRARNVVLVSFRTKDGLTGDKLILSNDLDCRVGDVVKVERVGVSLELAGKACRKTPPR